ncbi:uncharacterized protein BKA55DRAFT_581056 [Fusarium redolens]|uniref:Uncharacterized protein n=1 Tax=Fusarium redolens TaxID=48865 RepID=A0A9P9G3D9_FUSRE|nr:uncharacterized protein BKA55DRAFT_581056 [Fusarium redolens]KAH7232390.1 hypothetical protein BKA55DRAFT_581056 [Fusarium redolens]
MIERMTSNKAGWALRLISSRLWLLCKMSLWSLNALGLKIESSAYSGIFLNGMPSFSSTTKTCKRFWWKSNSFNAFVAI